MLLSEYGMRVDVDLLALFVLRGGAFLRFLFGRFRGVVLCLLLISLEHVVG